jgi:hypothetical protein
VTFAEMGEKEKSKTKRKTQINHLDTRWDEKR